MPSRPSQHYKHRPSNTHKHPRSHTHPAHHGKHQNYPTNSSLLLALPSESITHITSYLDPPALFTLAQTCQAFYDHVGDDNTWRRAFFCQFLHTLPEDTIQDDLVHKNALMLRRSESSWKREFVRRWNLRRRWERTRSSSTISHIPVHSTISDLHLLALDGTASSHTVLLTASLTYGVVARSQPLTGKIAKGFLDASGTLNGLGNGNPNAEFSPNLAQCVITSAGTTAKVLWAFKNGAVAVTVAQKAADFGKPFHAQWRRCNEQEAHAGSIEDATWVNVNGSSSRFFATAGVDGRAKLWDADHMRCLWTSPKQVGPVVPDSCVKIAVNSLHGVAAVLHRSGQIAVWCGLQSIFDDVKSGDNIVFHISPAACASHSPIAEPRSVLAFSVRMSTATIVSVLTAYEREVAIHKTVIDLESGNIRQIIVGDELLGEITAVEPVFPLGDARDERAFVLAGDAFGYTMIFAWDEEPACSPQHPSDIVSIAHLHRFPVFDGTPVAALHWNHATFTAGSAVGTLKVFDATTLDQLREFKLSFVRSLTSRDAITRIDVVRDILVATVDNRVYAWRGEPPGNSKNVRGKNILRIPNAVAKWHQHVEMYREIAESRNELEDEASHTQLAFGRAREQHATLDSLGLNEIEAVGYVLMLSRDEQQARERQMTDDSVFGGQFDEDVPTAAATPTATEDRPSTSIDQPLSSVRWAPSRTPPSLSGSSHTNRVQISPRLLPEPIEAGMDSETRRSLSLSPSVDNHPVFVEDESHFPVIPAQTRRSVSGSPESVRSAWSTPLRSTCSSDGPSSSRALGSGSVASSPVSRNHGPGVSLLSTRFAQMQTHASSSSQVQDDEDEDLRFAIELSLAEARSRGETV